MQYTIYFGNKPLYLTDTITPDLEEYLHQRETMFIDEWNIHTVKTMIHEMEQNEVERGVFLHKDVRELLESFKQRFTVIQAGGGLVLTPGRKMLLIFRRGKWDLPKGKLDEGEDLEACAVREVREETGLLKVVAERLLDISYHTYHQEGQHILKESHWYWMNTDEEQELKPQQEEDIEECKWVAISDLEEYLGHAPASIAAVVRKGLRELKKKD